jgi:hypothetical protein
MPTFIPGLRSKATNIGGTPINADAAVECLSLREALRLVADHSIDVDHLIRLDNSIALPALPFTIVVDGAAYTARAAVRGCGRSLSQMFAKKA